MNLTQLAIPSLDTEEKIKSINKQTEEYTTSIMNIVFSSFQNEDVTQINNRHNCEWNFVIGEGKQHEVNCEFTPYVFNIHSHRPNSVGYTQLKISPMQMIKLTELCNIYESLSKNKTAKTLLDYLSNSPFARAMKIDAVLLDMEQDN